MATAAVDVGYLASSLDFPVDSIVSLLDAPTREVIQSLLIQIEAKAKESDSLQADKLRGEVELENAIRSGQAQRLTLKASLDSALKEVEQLRRRLNDEESTRASLESELINLQSSTSTSTAAAESLHQRISTLETSNRDTIALLEAKSTAHDRLAEELASQHQKIVSLRRESSELQEKLQSAENASLTTKFKEQELQQEVDLLKRNNEWHENELQTRATEHSKFRKEKAARITELQRQNEDLAQTVESLKRTETSLRNRIDEVTQKAEDAIGRVQQLQEAVHTSEEAFRVELDSANRLANLHEQNAETTRRRLKDVQEQVDKIREQAHHEIGTLQSELETVSFNKDAAEQRNEELENQIETLQSDLASQRAQHAPVSVPGTPRRGLNGTFGTPGRAGSPSVFSPNRTGMKGGLSFTQLYSENEQLKGELGKERHEVARLRKDLEEVYGAFERNAPQLEEMQAEYANLQNDINDMSAALDEARSGEQSAIKRSRQSEGQVAGLQRQIHILEKQLRDFGAQIKILLIEISHRDDPTSMNVADRALFESAARGELDDSALEQGLSESDRFITKRLTIFRDVSEAQEKNERLLHMIRGLQEQLEGEEAQAGKEQQERDRQELEELRQTVHSLQDTLASQSVLIESFKKERDTYKAMHLRRSQAGRSSVGPSDFGQSFLGSEAPGSPQTGGQAGLDASTSHVEGISRLLKDVQTSFDQFREESNVNTTALKQQVDRLSKEKSELQSEIARASSQLTLQVERYELLQSNLGMLKNENGELQKRSQVLSEAASKQELHISTIMEQLVDEKALHDGLRNENSNLKAERDLWKKVEARLSEDNRQLLDDRSRLNKMIMDVQNLQNEKELAESENRRRLASRADVLESELATLKRKLDDEIEENKKATLRREYDQEQNRGRVDDLLGNLSAIKEELVAAKTQRDQLQSRVDELKIELKGAEEKAQALQPRPTPRVQAATTANGDDAGGIDREQELGVEVADLKRDLELAKKELAVAKQSVEQYRAISQASEEELQSINETHDQYQQDSERIIAEKDEKIQDIEKRVEEVAAELTTTNQELTELRTSYDEITSKNNEQKASLEADIARLTDDAERLNETVKMHQEDKQAQAEIAQKAQQSYEDELVKHADAARTLHKVRAEYSELRNAVSSFKAEAEAAKASLAQNESSWAETKERYERELLELTTRREDLNVQNKLLHGQMEKLSAQITSLRQSRVSAAADAQTTETSGPASEGENLQEVIKFLRREKEIVDIQYEGSQREAKRLKQQLDHAQSQFEQTREKLNQERQSQAEKEQITMSHNNLLQTINELNAFRESNASLRNEARQAQAQLAEKIKEIEDVRNQIQPLQTRLNAVEAELENKQEELRLLTDDRDHWQRRVNDIIQKYDRVDPAELESLRNQIQSLTQERDELSAEKVVMKARIDGVTTEVKDAEDLRDQICEARVNKLKESVKLRSQQIKVQINAKDDQIKEKDGQLVEKDKQLLEVGESRDRLAQELDAAKRELEVVKKARDDAVLRAQAANQPKDVEMVQESEAGEINEQVNGEATANSDTAALEARLAAALQQARVEVEKTTLARNEVIQLQTRITELESQVQTLQQQIGASSVQAGSAQTSTTPAASTTEQIQPLDGTATDARVDEAVAARRAELEAEYQNKVKQMEASTQESLNRWKNQYQTKLNEGKLKLNQERQQLNAQHAAALAELKKEHEAQIAQLSSTASATKQNIQPVEPTANQSVPETATPATEQPATEPAPLEPTVAESPITTDAQVPVKTEEAEPLLKANASDKDVKDFLAKNQIAINILRHNIQARVGKEREAFTEKVKGEHEKAMQEVLEEARKKADIAKDNAVAMESKKHNVKLNMTENRLKIATAKIDVVETAARDTPQKPVGEVWEIAKVAKPVAAVQPGQPPATPSTAATPRPANAQNAVQSGTPAQAGQAPAALVPVQAQLPRQPPPSFGQPTRTASPAPIQQFGQAPVTQFIPNTNIPIVPPGTFSSQPNQFTGVAQGQAQQPLPSQPPVQQQQQQQQQQAAPNVQNRPANAPNAGTGPGALRNIIGGGGSGIPRGGGIPRPQGRGQAGQTGIPQPGSNTSGLQIQGAGRAQPQQQGQSQGQRSVSAARGGAAGGGRGRGQGVVGGPGGPSSPNMNPAAKQFVPGAPNSGAAGANKRPRDDDGEPAAAAGRGGGGTGKRARGGHGQGGPGVAGAGAGAGAGNQAGNQAGGAVGGGNNNNA